MPPPTTCAARCLPIDMSKQELRAFLKERRAAIPPEEKKVCDQRIVEIISAMPAFREASAVLMYAPRGSELDLIPLVRVARGLGKAVAFPRCDIETNTMQFYVLLPEARLVKGAYGIFEPPADAPLCETDERTLCILPGLSFSPDGSRLGYGKGYYDRFLATFRGVTVGAAYASMVAKSLPVEPHDIPVQLLVTERGVMRCGVNTTDKNDTARPKKQGVSERLLSRIPFLRDRKKSDVRAVTMCENGTNPTATVTPSAQHAPAILVACTFVLLLLSRLVELYLTDRDNEYAVVIFLQLIIFLVPAAVYLRLRRDRLLSRMRLRLPPPRQIWFAVSMLAVMISGGLLCGILTGGVGSLTGNFTLYSTFVARMGGSTAQTLYVILAYGVLPAFCEEAVFRAILCAEYERFGAGVAIAASGLFFAMLHFSFPLFLSYFFLGAVLACVMYTTRSFFTAVVLHLLYNLFCLFGQPYLSAFYVNAGSNEIFVFCLLVIFLLFSAFAAGEARKIYHRYAKAALDSEYAPAISPRTIPKNLFYAMLSPAVAVCIVIWLTMSIVDLL